MQFAVLSGFALAAFAPLFHRWFGDRASFVLAAYPAMISGARIAFAERYSSAAFWGQVVAAEAKSAETLERLDGLRAELWKILEKQLRAKVQASLILHKPALVERAAQAGHVQPRAELTRQQARQRRLPGTRRTDEQDVALLDFHVTVGEDVFRLESLVMIVYRNGERPLRGFLSDDIIIQRLLEIRRRAVALRAGCLARERRGITAKNIHRTHHAMIADVYVRSGNNAVDLLR